jgi:hypothetical protein
MLRLGAHKKNLFVYFIAAQPDEVAQQRRLVEAMGIEPMSALQITPSATCLFFDYTHTTPQRHSLLYETTCDTRRATKLCNLTR